MKTSTVTVDSNTTESLQVVQKTLKQFGLNSVQLWGPDALWWLLALRPGEWTRIVIPSKTYQLYSSWFSSLWNLSTSDVEVPVGLHLGTMTKSQVIPQFVLKAPSFIGSRGIDVSCRGYKYHLHVRKCMPNILIWVVLFGVSLLRSALSVLTTGSLFRSMVSNGHSDMLLTSVYPVAILCKLRVLTWILIRRFGWVIWSWMW